MNYATRDKVNHETFFSLSSQWNMKKKNKFTTLQIYGMSIKDSTRLFTCNKIKIPHKISCYVHTPLQIGFRVCVLCHKLWITNCVCMYYLVVVLVGETIAIQLGRHATWFKWKQKAPIRPNVIELYTQAVAENSHTFSSAVNKILARSLEGSDLLQ